MVKNLKIRCFALASFSTFEDHYLGDQMFKFAQELWPLNRSLTGEGNRQTLKKIKSLVPELEVKSFKSGTKVFDWKIPKEWRVKSAFIKPPRRKKICDFDENNLHLFGYSVAVDKTLSLDALQAHLHSLPDRPDAIPYVTSYYEPNWDFAFHTINEMLLKVETTL